MFITNTNNQIVEYKSNFLESSVASNSQQKLITFSQEETDDFFKKLENLKNSEQYRYGKELVAIKGSSYNLINPNKEIDNYYTNNRGNLAKNGDSQATVKIGDIEGNLIFDLNGSNSIDNLAENLKTRELFMLDSNRDGILNRGDEYFDKLQVVIKDENSEYKMVKLSSLASYIDLSEYIDKDLVNSKQKLNPLLKNTFLDYVDAKYTHKELESKEVKELFDTYANSSGWIELEDTQESKLLFSNLAYNRKNADDKSYVQKFNSLAYTYSFSAVGGALSNLSYGNLTSVENNKVTVENTINAQKENFLNLYDEYIKRSQTSLSTTQLKPLEREFERLTNMKFSQENLEKVKSMVDSGNFSKAFIDVDTVIGIKKDKDGSYMLKFDSGRIVKTDKLYMNSGDFLQSAKDRNKVAEASAQDIVKLDKNEDKKIDSTEINFDNLAVKLEEKASTLKELGVKTINLYQENQTTKFQLEFLDGSTLKVDDIYSVDNSDSQFKLSSEQLKNLLKNPYNQPLEQKNTTEYFA